MHTLIIFGAKYLFIIVGLIYCVAWLQASRFYKKQMAVAIVAAGVIAGIIDKISGKLYYDPRPFVTHHITPLVAHAADNGFPSEHTIFTFAVATVLYFYRPKLSYLVFVLAALVGISRVAAHVHSPIDILGGLVMGVVGGIGAQWLVRRYLPKAKAESKAAD